MGQQSGMKYFFLLFIMFLVLLLNYGKNHNCDYSCQYWKQFYLIIAFGNMHLFDNFKYNSTEKQIKNKCNKNEITKSKNNKYYIFYR